MHFILLNYAKQCNKYNKKYTMNKTIYFKLFEKFVIESYKKKNMI